ncbi:MAG: hypothetical protein HXY40_14070 [Chloroflexi bacterium]|nr:hypothetical protein [Chloroflexota bacterium]
MTREQRYAEAFKSRLTEKIQTLLDDFATGKINRDQFHALYERYSARLLIADHALLSGNPDAVAIAESGPSTLQILEQTGGKALGLLIYDSASAAIIETLGQFTVTADKVQPLLADFMGTPHAENCVAQVDEQQWLLLVAGRFTTVVTLFKNEPSRLQTREIERLHRDFEEANHNALAQPMVDASKLGYPFLAFVQKKLGKANHAR